MFNFAHSTWVARLSEALAAWVLPGTHNINMFDITVNLICV